MTDKNKYTRQENSKNKTVCRRINKIKNATYWITHIEHAWHTTQDCCIDITRAVCCANNHDTIVPVSGETVPEAHELSLDHRRGLVVCCCT